MVTRQQAIFSANFVRYIHGRDTNGDREKIRRERITYKTIVLYFCVENNRKQYELTKIEINSKFSAHTIMYNKN